MLSKIYSVGLLGIDGFTVTVEADISSGMPSFEIVGLPDATIKESKDRIRAAMRNCNLPFPSKHITVNLAPANMKKEGATYDLPIAVSIMVATSTIDKEFLDQSVFIGELALDGSLRGINGILPMAIAAKSNGFERIFVPSENAQEASIIEGIAIYPVKNLYELLEHLQGTSPIIPIFGNSSGVLRNNGFYGVDFADVKGQESVKRAVEVAVAGGHNVLMIGSPGSGKSMIARRIPTILPDMTNEEAIEVTKIHSVAGTIPPGESFMSKRPFRSPHHTISSAGLAGGGPNPKPGELSLAHHGVLFMDELPEFHKDVLEVLRQPMEDGFVTISRVMGTVAYPCNTLFVGAMNPCKCGYHGDEEHICRCTPQSIEKYRSRISGPLMDRIDIHITVPSVKFNDLHSKQQGERSTQIKQRVDKAREIQLSRFAGEGIFSNAQMSASQIERYCALDEDSKNLLELAYSKLGLSARAHSRILKVARTIADLDDSMHICADHIAEAIQYRRLDRDYMGV
ncbi:MAG: YifB family Mg chelatase-like AAA ATPase [Eubacteriales bacterium]|nr:YifB family Mg chelatase-like AAA ATPase [Eubacteriales bacterium]